MAASLIALLGALALPTPGGTWRDYLAKAENIPPAGELAPGSSASSSPSPPSSP